MLEQKVGLTSGGSVMYPNIYAFLVGHPGVGKTRTIRAVKGYLAEVEDFHLAPTSMTAAAMVDALIESKRLIMRLPDPPLEYNTMLVAADELGALISKYDEEMIAVLSAFYDPDPYGHRRRGKDIKFTIKKPQLSLLCGTTPSNLLRFMPEGAWDQGFTSRIIMVFSDERLISDDFEHEARGQSADLVYDIRLINSLVGEYSVTSDFKRLVIDWREGGEKPVPNHPKLLHYNSRRRAHLYKLAMVSAADRTNTLVISADDFHRALAWLTEVESFMPDIFKAGMASADATAMDEIYHYILIGGKTPEWKIVNYARERVPAHSVLRVIEIMERSGMIKMESMDPKTGYRYFSAVQRQ